jgi:hypothetical protein
VFARHQPAGVLLVVGTASHPCGLEAAHTRAPGGRERRSRPPLLHFLRGEPATRRRVRSHSPDSARWSCAGRCVVILGRRAARGSRSWRPRPVTSICGPPSCVRVILRADQPVKRNARAGRTRAQSPARTARAPGAVSTMSTQKRPPCRTPSAAERDVPRRRAQPVLAVAAVAHARDIRCGSHGLHTARAAQPHRQPGSRR